VIGTPSPAVEARPIAPEHRSNPYRPDSMMDGWGTDRFVLRAASLRGQLHRYLGVPRQDDAALSYHQPPGRLVVAVADGVSAAAQSHLGATMAVRYAVQWLTERLSAGDSVATIDWLELFHHAAWQIIEQGGTLFGFDQSAEPAKAAENLLATTLVCAVIDFPREGNGATLHAASVGDSSVWVLTDRTYSQALGGKGKVDSPIASSEVSGLPRVPPSVTPTVVEVPAGGVILVGTDGFGDPLGTGEGAVGQGFAQKLARPPSMLEFVHLLDFSRETFDDDRTLVTVWPLARGVSPTP
jgi:protein phosphatase 2C-like protein